MTLHGMTPHRLAAAGAWLEHAAVSGENFSGSFDEAARMLGARTFYMARLGADGSLGFFADRSALEAISDYRSHRWESRDLWSQRASRAARKECHVVTDAGLVQPHERRRDAFFQEYCRKWELGHFAAWRMNVEGEAWVGTLIRPPHDDFGADEAAALDGFAQSVRRAALFACRFRDARIAGLAEGLEHSGRPSIVINRAGRVAHVTSGALPYVDRAFRIRQGVLTGMNADTERYFVMLAQTAQDIRATTPAPFAINAPALSRPIVGVPMRLAEPAHVALPGASLILMLVDQTRQAGPVHGVVKVAFGLTDREAELSCLIGSGRTVAEAAAHMGLRASSARQVAKSVLAKAGVRRQAELAILLQRLVAG